MDFTIDNTRSKTTVKQLTRKDFGVVTSNSKNNFIVYTKTNNEFWLTVPERGSVTLYPMTKVD
jgi:hypothetical protein